MSDPFTLVLGTAQDGGVPHVGCRAACCAAAWTDPQRRRLVACLAIVDPEAPQRWLIDCTPDFPRQLRHLDDALTVPPTPGLDGILLTHAHTGHYAGLLSLGREALNANGVPVFAMPRMADFLHDNAPWRQLVERGHIVLRPLADGRAQRLNDRLRVTPFKVPHRGELSETVGFRIDGPQRSVLYLPDIDDWETGGCAIEDRIAAVDAAYLDGTFFSDAELPAQRIAEVPHPRIEASLRRFSALSEPARSRIRFTHFNHTNPVLDPAGSAATAVNGTGMRLAAFGERIQL